MSIYVSAIICTLNRVNYLCKAVQSLVDQTLPKENYEILIVDNGSTDNTKQLTLEKFHDIKNLRYIYEPVTGLSQARNTGFQNARGVYVAYLDDDAIASSQWLEKIIEIFQTVKPPPGIVGGKIELVMETPQPSWLPNNRLAYLGKQDLSKVPINLAEGQALFGGNIAFPRQLLEIVGGFRVDLGRKGNKLLSNEEILLWHQLRNKGYYGFYHPEISILHHIPAHKLTKTWFFRRAYWQGVSKAINQIHLESLSIKKRLMKGILITKQLLFCPRQLISLILPINNTHDFSLKFSALLKVGYILGILGFIK